MDSGHVSRGVVLRTDLINSIDKELGQLAVIHRMPVIKSGLRKACNVVRKRLQGILPKPGYPGDKPGLTPLREATATKVVEYDRSVVALVGYDYTGGGQHGHLVEEGHRIVKGGSLPRTKATTRKHTGTVKGFVEGRFYLVRAAKDTESEQRTVMHETVSEAVAKAKG